MLAEKKFPLHNMNLIAFGGICFIRSSNGKYEMKKY